MTIDDTTLKIWIKRLKHLPKSTVANELGISRQTLNNALNGSCNLDTMVTINNWLIANEDKKLTKTDNL